MKENNLADIGTVS